MGGTASVQTEQVTRAISEAVVKSAQTCEAEAHASIDLSFSGGTGTLKLNGKIDQSSKAAVSNCQQSSQITELLKNNLAQSLSQSAKNEGFSIWGNASSNSNTISEAINRVNVDEMKRCAPKDDATLKLAVQNQTGNVAWTPSVTQSAIATCEQCVMNNAVLQQNAQDVASVVNSNASNGMQFGIMAFIIMIVALLVFLAVVKWMFRTKTPSSSSSSSLSSMFGNGVSNPLYERAQPRPSEQTNYEGPKDH